MSTPLLEVRDLRVRFAVRDRARTQIDAVDGVSFALARGEVLALIGESGSGKSTLARAIVGLVPHASGSVLVSPSDAYLLDVGHAHAQDLRAVRRTVQLVFQDPFASLDPRMTIGAALAEPLGYHELARGDGVAQRAAELLDAVGLPRALAARLPHELSGGQAQRAAIARALAVEPALLLCDEVLAALDASVQAQVLELLARLRRERGLALLFIAHDLAAAGWLADRVAVMQRGRIVECDATERVLGSPRHAYTRALIDASSRTVK